MNSLALSSLSTIIIWVLYAYEYTVYKSLIAYLRLVENPHLRRGVLFLDNKVYLLFDKFCIL